MPNVREDRRAIKKALEPKNLVLPKRVREKQKKVNRWADQKVKTALSTYNAHRMSMVIFPLGVTQEAAYPVFEKVAVSPGRVYISTDSFIVLTFTSLCATYR